MSQDYKTLAEHLREQRLRGAAQGKQLVIRKSASDPAPQKREVSDKAASLIATALKDLLR